MVVRYPKIQPSALLGAPIATPPSIDQAALRMQERGGQALTEAANRVINYALERGETQAKFEGRRAGAENADQTLKAAQNQTPTNARQIAAYNAAVDVSIAEIDLDSREDIAKAIFDAEQNETDPSILYGTLKDIEDGYQSAIDLVDPVKGEALRTRISMLGTAAHYQYSGQYLTLEKKRVSNKWVSGRAGMEELVEAAGRNGLQDYGLIIEQYLKEGRDLGVEEHLLINAADKLQELGAIAQVRGGFLRAFEAGEGREYLKNFDGQLKDRGVSQEPGEEAVISPKGSPLEGISETHIKMLRSEMGSQLNAVEAEARRRDSANVAEYRRYLVEFNNRIKDQQAIADNNRPLTEGTAEALLSEARDTGDYDSLIAAELLRDTLRLNEHMSGMTPNEAIAFSAEYASDLSAGGTTPTEDALLDTVEKLTKGIVAKSDADIAEVQAEIAKHQPTVEANRALPEGTYESLLERAVETGDPETIADALLLGGTEAALSAMTDLLPEEGRQYLGELEAALSDGGITPTENDLINTTQTRSREISAAFAADPVAALQASGREDLPDITLEQIITNDPAVAARFEKMDGWSQELGIAFTPFSDAELAALDAYVTDPKTSVPAVGATVAGLIGVAGEGRAEEMLRQIGLKKPAIWVQAAAHYTRTGSTEFFYNTVRGIHATRLGTLPEGDAPDKFEMQATNQTYALFLSSSDVGSYAQTAEMAAIGARLVGSKDPMEASYAAAFETLMGNDGMGRGGTYNDDGHQIWLGPKEWRQDVEDTLKAKFHKNRFDQLNGPSILEGGLHTRDRSGKLSPASDTDYQNLIFISDGLSPGLVRVHNSEGSRFLDAKGGDYVIFLRDLVGAFRNHPKPNEYYMRLDDG
mgnify:CR=1 FL=1|tara:strand:- start:2 stop:2614 length:2613 start_codon:yes stop_codon:yes gene_type:complete